MESHKQLHNPSMKNYQNCWNNGDAAFYELVGAAGFFHKIYSLKRKNLKFKMVSRLRRLLKNPERK